MNIRNVAWALLILGIVTVLGGQLFAAPKPEDEALKSAEQWLSLVDAGKLAESWKTAADYLRTAVSQEQWERSLDTVRKPLGNLVLRKLESARYTRSVPGAPDGEYVILQFDTSFANKKNAIETVTPMLDKDGQWRVSGYYIR